jgi:deazaflavin-dependent oxidoreductase (nitroreductase family)
VPALNRKRRALSGAIAPLVRLGVVPRAYWLLTVPGRRTGRRYTTPVRLVSVGGERWLVAPYGEREWVKNARAAGRVELRRGRRRVVCALEELDAGERPAILAEYVRRVPITASFFDAPRGAPPEAFAPEAARHPVFRLRPQP